MKAMCISMCGGRVSLSVKLSIELFSQNFFYMDFLEKTYTTVTFLIYMFICLINTNRQSINDIV